MNPRSAAAAARTKGPGATQGAPKAGAKQTPVATVAPVPLMEDILKTAHSNLYNLSRFIHSFVRRHARVNKLTLHALDDVCVCVKIRNELRLCRQP